MGKEKRRARERKMTSWVTGWRAGRLPGFSQTVVKLSRSWRIPVLPSGFNGSFILALPTGTDGIRILCHCYSRLEYNRIEQSCKVTGRFKSSQGATRFTVSISNFSRGQHNYSNCTTLMVLVIMLSWPPTQAVQTCNIIYFTQCLNWSKTHPDCRCCFGKKLLAFGWLGRSILKCY